MKVIGIRELRQRASDVLREVEGGVTFEITDRGRPIALLGPLPDKEPLERLRASGDVSTPTGTLDDLPPPPPPPRIGVGKRPASAILTRLRAHER